MQVNPIVHLDIPAKDPAATSKFYADLCGWQIQVDEPSQYHMFSAQGGPGGGFTLADGKNYKVGEIIPYVGTDDIDAFLKKVEPAGGKLLGPKVDMPGIGAYAFFADPNGNRIGVYMALPHEH